MRAFIVLGFILLLSVMSSCNTLGGLGRDISQTGEAIDNAAGWSQTQINEVATDTEPQGDSSDGL